MKSTTTDLFGRPIGGRQTFTTGAAGGSKGRTRLSSEITTRVEHGDALDVLRRLSDEGVQCDSCVTDPPYHLTATVKRFQKAKVGGSSKIEQQAAAGEGFGRFAAGFMGQQWDGGDVAFRPETWAAVMAVMRPGAFLVAFGGTRTYHRLVCAIEDAGFVIQDHVLDLIKSDARVREFEASLSDQQSKMFSQILDDLQPGGELAWMFGQGFPKNRGTLKPSFEPIVLAYRPGGKRVLCVDECRAEVGAAETFTVVDKPKGPEKSVGWKRPHHGGEKDQQRSVDAAAAAAALGRWPANIVTDGSDEVLDLLPNNSSGPSADLSKFTKRQMSGFALTGGKGGFGDEGSVARFFYTAKAGEDDRQGSLHPTVKPVSLMRWLVRLVTPEGGLVIDPFAGTGSTGAAAFLEGVDSILIERDAGYVADIHRKLEFFRNKRIRTLY